MLWIVGTPIGNLSDISDRARLVLEHSAIVLCEDSRKAGLLMQHLGLKKKIVSHHKFNEKATIDHLIAELKEGNEIALISDAGMPCISDPGELLVGRCREDGIPVSVVPGPCAAILGLVLSSFAATPFQFVGFLEKKGEALIKQLTSLFHYSGTTVSYEAPHRIARTLQLVAKIAPDLPLFIAREITKTYEECLRGTANTLLTEKSIQNPKGEFVLVFSEHSLAKNYETLSPKDHVALLEREFSLSKKDAIKLAAYLRGMPKKIIYDDCLNSDRL